MNKWKTRIVGTLSAFLLVSMVGVAFAAWTANGTGSGQAMATNMVGVTATVATVDGDLYPGGSGDVKLTFSNTNAFPVTVTSVVLGGSVTASGGTGTCTTHGVTFGDKTGLSLAIGASTTLAHTFTAGAAMGSTSQTGCQGATFTIPVTITAVTPTP